MAAALLEHIRSLNCSRCENISFSDVSFTPMNEFVSDGLHFYRIHEDRRAPLAVVLPYEGCVVTVRWFLIVISIEIYRHELVEVHFSVLFGGSAMRNVKCSMM